MIIARRALTLRQLGNDRPVEATLAAPRFETGCWRCAYDISWPDRPRRHFGHGADSMHAIVIAMQMICAELYASEQFKAGELFFDAPGAGFSIPALPSMRDLLTAADLNAI